MNAHPHSLSLLADKYRAPIEFVERLIDEETLAVSASARLTTFVPIFVQRRVEERLRQRASAVNAVKTR